MFMMRPVLLSSLLIAASTLVIGCVSNRTPIQPPIRTNFTLQINQSYEALSNYTRIYFQDGRRIAEDDRDQWTTHCHLQVFDRSQKADYVTSIEPGSFGISYVKLRYHSSEYPYYGSDSGFFASVGFGLASFDSPGSLAIHEGPPSYYLYRVELKLNSADQPDVQTLICARKRNIRGYFYPTLSEIRQALGDRIEIKQPDA